MIIVGTYPQLSTSTKTCSLVQQLQQALDVLLPSSIALHLLPPYPSSGDGGFAPDDWFSIRPQIGNWQEIADWAATRRLILDGIYNHVGREHPFVVEFFNHPSEQGPIYAYKCDRPPSEQLSPRGGSVFHSYLVGGNQWQIWQTFSDSSFDIRLTQERVISEIRRHLDFLRNSGIYGVRLDGCAYYGHELGVEQFHNPSGKRLTQFLAREASERSLYTIAQLDADPSGASYFLGAEGWSVPVVDYAYSAVLVRALLTQSASAIAMHLERTSNLPCNALRPPRTHDGILLLSDLLTNEELQDLDRVCNDWNLSVRIANDEKYEINSSLPYICSLGVDEDAAWNRILIIVVLTGFISGIPYFYLPFILGDIPEQRAAADLKDPRAVNRLLVTPSHVDSFAKSPRAAQLREALHIVERIRSSFVDGDVIISSVGAVLTLLRSDSHWFFGCNFSTTTSASVHIPTGMHLIWGLGAEGTILAPLGVGVWHSSPERT